MTRFILTYTIALLGAILWCSGIILAPLLVASGGDAASVGALLYEFFRPICHQIDGRSFHLAGEPLGVCVRCASIYFAFLAGVILYPAVRRLNRPVIPPRRWLLLAAVPMLLDVIGGISGLHEITAVTRTFSGAILGIVLPFYILPAALEAVGAMKRIEVSSPS